MYDGVLGTKIGTKMQLFVIKVQLSYAKVEYIFVH